jgi:hypothetical protein
MSNSSDRNGRALEYRIVDELVRQIAREQIQLTPRAIQAQRNDRQKYLSLGETEQRKYSQCAKALFNWLDQHFSISSHTINLDRLSDNDAKKGDVTDIRLTIRSEQINLSVKHNHKALKHQRPASTAQHCGYSRRSFEDAEFRNHYKVIVNLFRGFVQDAFYFRDLEEGIVMNHLYIPTCHLVADFINQLCCPPEKANHLFRFLVGTTDFYKVIFDPSRSRLLIQLFAKPDFVESVIAEANQNYVYLNFANSWKLAMRLHTASSRLGGNPSLKFDTQLSDEIMMPGEVLDVGKF